MLGLRNTKMSHAPSGIERRDFLFDMRYQRRSVQLQPQADYDDSHAAAGLLEV